MVVTGTSAVIMIVGTSAVIMVAGTSAVIMVAATAMPGAIPFGHDIAMIVNPFRD